jgi:hypothetical protein
MAEIARVEEREKLQAELSDIRLKLANIDTRPTVADPIVGNLAKATAIFTTVDERDYALIGWANDLHTAVFVELAAALGPMLFVFLIGLLWRNGSAAPPVAKARKASATSEKAAAKVAPEKTAIITDTKPASTLPADTPACVLLFLEERIVETPGGKIGAGDLYQAYVGGCDSEPVSQNKFGRIVGKLYEKDGARYPSYVGIALRGPRLVTAAAE